MLTKCDCGFMQRNYNVALPTAPEGCALVCYDKIYV